MLISLYFLSSIRVSIFTHSVTSRTFRLSALGRVFNIVLDSVMIIVLSKFVVANDMVEEVRLAFNRRPHLVDSVAGFLGMEVMSPIDNPSEVWLLTRWLDEQSYRTWHKGHAYHDSHTGIPKGLKLVPGATEIKLLEVFAN